MTYFRSEQAIQAKLVKNVDNLFLLKG